jgi:drug/metabolite transporter (DMT)-like permease
MPPRLDILLMTVAVAAVSTSGPLMAGAAAPALAIAFWRNFGGAAAVTPYALLRHRAELVRLGRRELVWTLCSGVMLALHFATWAPSLRLTSVASATALVATLPIWVALLSRFTGHEVPVRAWWGIGLSMVAVLMLTGVDLSVSGRALAGDLLALAGGVFAALYTMAGAEVRRTVTTTAYTFWCYGTAAVVLLACCLVARQQLWGYSGRTWLALLALTAGAQLLGHSLFNVVLRTTSPTVVALVLLLEVPGAAAIAAVTLDQQPPAAVIPAAVLLLVGIAVVVSARSRDVPPTFPVD